MLGEPPSSDMAVNDPAVDSIDAARTADGRVIPMSEHTIVVVADADQPIECWVGDRYSIRHGFEGGEATEADLLVLDPDRGGEIGLESDGGAVIASLAGTDGADAIRSTHLGTNFDREALRETIDRLDRHARHDALLAEFARLAARRGALEAERDQGDLDSDREYCGFRRRLADVEAELDSFTRSFDGEDFRAAFETAGFAPECGRAE